MSIDRKYAALPDLDIAPDVYETPDLTDDASTIPASTLPRPESITPSTEDVDDESITGISRQRLDPDEARSHFLPNQIRSTDLENSNRIKSKRRSYKESRSRNGFDTDGSAIDESDEEVESLETKLARLQREVAEVKATFAARKKHRTVNREKTSEDEEGLDSLSTVLHSMKLQSSAYEQSTASDLVQRIKSTAKDRSGTEQASVSLNGHPAKPEPSYTVSYAPNYAEESTLSKVADFDSRLTLLESALGIDTIALPIQVQSQPKPVLPALASIDRQLSVISASTDSTLDSTNRRVKQLVQDANRLTEARKSAKAAQEALNSQDDSRPALASRNEVDARGPPGLEDPEQVSRINALYGTLSTIESLSPVLPALLDRLRSLRSVHAEAAVANQALAQVESKQAAMMADLRDWRAGLEKIEASIEREQSTMGGNLGTIEQWVKDLENRIQSLSK